MMPSVCTKPDNKASNEASDPIKQAILIVDKKVRNLEKRKGKLDGYREKAAIGNPLNDDQKEAVGRYDAVVQTLEFARELHKQFTVIQSEAEKLQKKQQKRDSHERQQLEIRRLKELLSVQMLLDNLGAEEVRADFVAGNGGAVQLQEAELDKLDELYKLICPTRDFETSYEEQLVAAGEHIVNYLDAREKEVAGTTYKDLKSLITRINECGYFDKKNSDEPAAPEAPAEPAEAEETEETETVAVEPVVPVDTTPAVVAEEFPPQVPAPVEPEPEQNPAVLDFGLGAKEPTSSLIPTEPTVVDDETFFSTRQFPQPRPFNEIVSSVQGNFNFLQDSEIEQQQQSSTNDAAVAAQMAVAAADPAAAAASLSCQISEAFRDDQYKTNVQNQETPESAAYSTDMNFADDPNIYTQSLIGQQYAAAAAAAADTFADQTAFTQQQQQAGSGTEADASGPAPIPMPGQYENDADKNKKQFAMNPNADIFQSMYSQQGSDQYQQNNSANSWSADFQQQGYSNQYRRGGGGGSAGYRGNQPRGMTNGYRGGSARGGGGATGARGGGGGNRGAYTSGRGAPAGSGQMQAPRGGGGGRGGQRAGGPSRGTSRGNYRM